MPPACGDRRGDRSDDAVVGRGVQAHGDRVRRGGGGHAPTFPPALGYRQVGAANRHRPADGVTAATFLHSLVDSARMHSMTESAISLREQKRWDTSRRITLLRPAAHRRPRHRRLHDGRARGGRRGLAAHPLQLLPEQDRRRPRRGARRSPEADLATFVAGGPHGNLVDDVAELARIALDGQATDRESLELGRRVLNANPRLLACAHERFEARRRGVRDARRSSARAPTSPPAGPACCSTCSLALFDTALVELIEDTTDRTLVEVFDDQLATARTLFA